MWTCSPPHPLYARAQVPSGTQALGNLDNVVKFDTNVTRRRTYHNFSLSTVAQQLCLCNFGSAA